ncbi:MAG: two-component sensor histidine kinase [Acidobacteria bacterium]|nr:MAG: two-component sensor histidine kinase [Acidobacteriota bacterium]
MKRLSIGLRLTVWYLAIFAPAQLIFGVGMWFILRENLHDIADTTLAGEVEDVRRFLEGQRSDQTLDQLRAQVTDEYSAESGGDYLQIIDADGNWIYRSAALAQAGWSPISPSLLRKSVHRDGRIGRVPFRFVSQRIEVRGHAYTVQAGTSTSEEDETLERFQRYLLMFAPLLLLAAGGGGYWLSRRALAPVDALTRTARTITGHTLSSRLEQLHTRDELQRLSDTLNEMLARIEVAFRRVTEFTADASHELRTPISLIRTEAELVLRRSRGEQEYREALRHILLEAERTTSLIEELLALARADSGRQALNIQPIDLRGALKEVASGWRQVANVRGLQFSERILDAELRVLGDSAALRRVLDILLDNAFKYTPSPGGTVVLSAEEKDGAAIISVRDNGMGIAESEQSRIFERFYRVDKARSREMGGAGLGLAIAQWIVLQHNGKILVESTLGAGSIFRVQLPLAAAKTSKELLLQ